MRNATVALISLLASYSASAIPIVYDFTGTVTELTSSFANRDGDQSGIEFGASVSGSFEYDPEMLELVPTGSAGVNGVPGYSLQVGPRTIHARSPYLVNWVVNGQRFEDIAPVTDNDSLFWIDDVYWMFAGLEPGFPPNLDNFDSATILFEILTWAPPGSGRNFDGGARVTSTIDTWQRRTSVPEPATLGLLGVGLLAAVAVRRRTGCERQR